MFRLSFLLLFLLSGLSSQAQYLAVYGAIKGNVMGVNKTPIKEAIVEAILHDHLIAADTTDENGAYSLMPLAPNINYSILITHDSFRTTIMNPIQVSVGRTTYQNFPLNRKTGDSNAIDTLLVWSPMRKTKIDPDVFKDCPKKYKNTRCPICKKKKNVIPVSYGLPAYASSSYNSKLHRPYIDYYPGGCVITDCSPQYYCKKDELLF